MFQKSLTIAAFALLTGCTAKEPVDPTTSVMEGEETEQGPGSEAWAQEDITCSANTDCLVGESCLNNVCQPTQCEGGLVVIHSLSSTGL